MLICSKRILMGGVNISRVRELEEERVRELEAYLHEAGFEDCTLSKEEESLPY